MFPCCLDAVGSPRESGNMGAHTNCELLMDNRTKVVRGRLLLIRMT